MSEPVLGVARERLRFAEPPVAVAILHTLGALGDRRAVPVVAEMVNHLDETVRFAAVRSLAAMHSAEAATALIRSVNHREPETQRYVVREIGNAGINAAVPALSRALEDISMFSRTYETRKEIIRALERIGTPEAEKALRGFARHVLRLGKKTRELRNLAIAVADNLAKNRGVSAP
jgi:HEAT repeat protein